MDAQVGAGRQPGIEVVPEFRRLVTHVPLAFQAAPTDGPANTALTPAVVIKVTDPGALMAGKYLSPKVYIRYSYGLFNRIGGLLLRFKVSDKVSIETRSGDQESMDVIYNIEKD